MAFFTLWAEGVLPQIKFVNPICGLVDEEFRHSLSASAGEAMANATRFSDLTTAKAISSLDDRGRDTFAVSPEAAQGKTWRGPL